MLNRVWENLKEQYGMGSAFPILMEHIAEMLTQHQETVGIFQEAYVEYLNTHNMPCITDLRARNEKQ